MDVLFLVVDSLRAQPFADGRVGRTPFLDSLRGRGTYFSRAYATECWTLPSHVSMFTGLMPSQHGAHFQTMAYRGTTPTIAERLRSRGYRTTLLTRNFVFDGAIPGVCRGFDETQRVTSAEPGWDPVALFLALAKPRVRRHLRQTGFFSSAHRGDSGFVESFARSLRPADAPLLEQLLETLAAHRRRNQRCFLFANLYDVHAPYAPEDDSLLRPWRSLQAVQENLRVPFALARLGEHRYLREGFRIAEATREVLVRRYRRAVERVDRLLASFFAELAASGLDEHLLIVLVSDHGEAFGEHSLYLHDGSVFETHISVPLWVGGPGVDTGVVDDVVSTRHLADLVERASAGQTAGTILDAAFRQRHPVAYAQHFHYPHIADARPECRGEQFAAVAEGGKLLLRGGGAELYEGSDGEETTPVARGGRSLAEEWLMAQPASPREWRQLAAPTGVV